jgi:carbamoyl-phosphate synthase large subunit
MSHMMQDKWESWEFARENGLPFAETALGGTPAAVEQCLDMARRYGYPLVAKPRLGYSSLGVRLLFDAETVRRTVSIPGDIIQVFLDPLGDWSSFTADRTLGVPLFRGYSDPRQYSCQTIIGPDRTFTPLFCMRNVMVNGRSEYGEICRDPRLDAVAVRYTEAVIRGGWRGPFNLQCRRLPDGSYAGLEMNGRPTGATSARAWLGFDEIGHLVERFVGPGRLPPHPRVEDAVVIRFPTSYPLRRSAVRHLEEHREWSAD